MPLKLTRYYNSAGGEGMFKTNWRTEFDVRLEISGSGWSCNSLNDGRSAGCNGGAIDPNSITKVRFIGISDAPEFNPAPNLPPYASPLNGRHFAPKDKTKISESIDLVGNIWTYADGHGKTYQFNTIGKLLTISNLNGISWSFSYTSSGVLNLVTHSSGRTLKFNWNIGSPMVVNGSQYSQNLLRTITLPNGEALQADYSYKQPASNSVYSILDSISYVPGNLHSRGYTYNYNGNKVTSIQIEGKQWSDYKYNADLSKVDYSGLVGGLFRSAFIFSGDDKAAGSVKVSNAKGGVQTYTYDAKRRLKGLDKTASAVCPYTASAFEYINDTDDLVKYKDDWQGNRTAYTYYTVTDTAGAVLNTKKIRYEYVNGITKEYFWDTYGRLTQLNIWDGAKDSSLCKSGAACPAPGLQPKLVTAYDYDNTNSPQYKNRLKTESTKALKYNSGQYTETRTTNYIYTFYPNNIIHELTGTAPSSSGVNRTVKIFDDNGNLRTVTNAKQQVTSFDYDNRNSGLANHMTDANGLRTDVTYDRKGRVTTKTINDGTPKFTQYDYYGDDQLKKITYPNGEYLEKVLDNSWRVQSVYSPLPNPGNS